MAKSKRFSNEQEFEKKLFYTLKRFGYLFPENKEDVEKFEALYGDTEIEIPENLQNLDILKNEEELPFDFDINYNVAAFSSGVNNLEFPEEDDQNQEDDEEDDLNSYN